MSAARGPAPLFVSRGRAQRRAPRGRFLLLLALACACEGSRGPGPGDGDPPARDGAVVDAASRDGAARDGAGRDGAGRDGAGRDGAGRDGAGRDGASAPDAGGASSALVILALNLHCLDRTGTRFATERARLEALAAIARAEGASALALQEVCSDGTTDALALLVDALEAATSAPWSSVFAQAHLAWEGTPREAREGLAVVVRGPVDRELRLTHAVQGSLRRVAVGAQLAGGPLLLSVHFDHEAPDVRVMQAREAAVAALVAADPGLDVVVAGDLNARAGAPAHEAFLAAGFLDTTEALRATRIDHAFVHRGARLRPVAARLLFDGGAAAISDHPAVLLRLEPSSPVPVAVTRIEGRVDVGPGHFVSIRGAAAPLEWTRGWPLANVSPSAWRYLSTELEGELELKLLRDDAVWQMGPNERARGGADHTVTPSF